MSLCLPEQTVRLSLNSFLPNNEAGGTVKMTELLFKGKEFVYNHHLAVPHRPLVPDAGKSVGTPDLAGNLIIQGDNLHALKALLPFYAGKVDCILIDPPYNTGAAFEHYDDGLEHSIWLSLMRHRMLLLKSLLHKEGVIFVQIDDKEMAYLRILMDEVFERKNFLNMMVNIQ